MQASTLYKKLEKDFIKPGLTDNWFQYMDSVADFLSENFKKRSMGLVCDFAKEVNKVYTAVFPSKKVMREILENKEGNALLFVHHPSIWDIRKAPNIFTQMDRKLLEKFKKMNISIYNLHVPLDNYGKYSTGTSLAKALNIKIEKPFANYYGGFAGIVGKTKFNSIDELHSEFSKVLGHKTSLYQYGYEDILNCQVSLVTGGGFFVDALKEVFGEGVNVYITGITAKDPHYAEAHKFAKEKKINILGGTHYSTEKFACKAMCNYFRKIGLPAEFIEDEPIMEDL